jgi:hypothetical protein
MFIYPYYIGAIMKIRRAKLCHANQPKLLQKIDELTLYLIQKDRQLKEQVEKPAGQERRIVKLEGKRKTSSLHN